MPSLFMVMLGGRHARANTEVHDVVFAVADSLEESYPQLKNAWFGEQKGLHIDAWMQVEGVESAGEEAQRGVHGGERRDADGRGVTKHHVSSPLHVGEGDAHVATVGVDQHGGGRISKLHGNLVKVVVV